MLSLPFESPSLHTTPPAPAVTGLAEEPCCTQSGCTCSEGRQATRAGTGARAAASTGPRARTSDPAHAHAKHPARESARDGTGSTGDLGPADGSALAPVIPLRPRQPVTAVPQDREAGMATAEYAIATLAAVAFAALLVAVLSSGDVRELLLALIRGALSFG
ncbi:DUF4244 domain-containing protein [Arthrobacter luteolus]|uniref:DUF4244 domain-containing protein n=1 Tax=Arthrobacter luteolus TaxID=98672 RepID=UPI000AB723D1|nr:DUF4244 domain-containing protein [Arthrobacter luteolus]